MADGCMLGVRLVQTITRGDPDTVRFVAENTHPYAVLVKVDVTGTSFTDWRGQEHPLLARVEPEVRPAARHLPPAPGPP
jgi:hypothetical protein